MNVKTILIGIASIWVFIVIGTPLLGVLFSGNNAPLNQSASGSYMNILTNASNFGSYGGIVSALAGFVPLLVALAFVLPILGAVGIGGYMAYSAVRRRGEM